jgi:transcription initiation factor IIE alpha subunit
MRSCDRHENGTAVTYPDHVFDCPLCEKEIALDNAKKEIQEKDNEIYEMKDRRHVMS